MLRRFVEIGSAKADVRGDAFAKKCVLGAPAGPVEKLRRQEHVARRIFFLQTADRRDANNPANVQRTQRVNVGPMIQLVREDAMPAAVPRQKIDLPSGCIWPPMSRVGRFSKWRFDLCSVGFSTPSI